MCSINAVRLVGWTYGFYPLMTLDPDAAPATKHSLRQTLGLWNRRNNHLVPKATDPLTQFDQRDDLYYAGMVPLNALLGDGNAAHGNITEFLGTEQEATGCLPIGTKCPPCDRSVGVTRRWNHCITPTAFYLETNNPVYEGPLMVANGLQEMLLYGRMGGTTLWPGEATKVKLFPAVPNAWRDAVYCNLLAEGGLVVSARMAEGAAVVFTVRATRSTHTQVEIWTNMRSDTPLCVLESSSGGRGGSGGDGGGDGGEARAGAGAPRSTLAWLVDKPGVIGGKLALGITVTVFPSAASGGGCPTTVPPLLNTTTLLPGSSKDFHHYGYKPLAKLAKLAKGA